jgi:hypothetical protein
MGIPFLPSIALSQQKLADYMRSAYHVKAPYGTTIEDVLRPTFWSFHVSLLKPGDLVDVVAEDNSFDVTLRVVDKAIGKVVMRELRRWTGEAKAQPGAEPDSGNVTPGFTVSFAPKTKWRVIRDADRLEMVRDFPTRTDAEKWAMAHADDAVVTA